MEEVGFVVAGVIGARADGDVGIDIRNDDAGAGDSGVLSVEDAAENGTAGFLGGEEGGGEK